MTGLWNCKTLIAIYPPDGIPTATTMTNANDSKTNFIFIKRYKTKNPSLMAGVTNFFEEHQALYCSGTTTTATALTRAKFFICFKGNSFLINTQYFEGFY